MSVQRYSPEAIKRGGGAWMRVHSLGGFVAHESYAALEAECARLREFVRDIVTHGDSWCCGIDGGDLWEMLESHKLIEPVPGGFNPEEHNDSSGCCSPGDDFYRLTWSAALARGGK